MAFSRGSQKTVKKKKQEEAQKQKSCLLNENTFPGLLFKKNINNTHSTLTALKNRPNIVLSEKNIVIFDYSNVDSEKDLNQLHATFSTMIPQKSTFILNNAHYVQDEFSINAEINGTYKFLNFMNGNLIVAEAPSNLSGYDRMKWNSKFFIKTPQIEIFDEFQSSRNVDILENLIDNPSFKDWGIIVGDTIKFIGTKHNDDNAAMVIHVNDEGTEMTLSEILKNENTIGIPIKIQHYRICSEIKTDTIYETQKPIEATSHKKSRTKSKPEIKPIIKDTPTPEPQRNNTGGTRGGSRSSATCPKGYHSMPDGTCMEGETHQETLPMITSTPPTPTPPTPRPRTSTPPTPRTSTPRRSTTRTSTPRTSTPRTSTPPPSMGGGGSGY